MLCPENPQIFEKLSMEDKPVFPDENENNLSTDSSINGELDAANETPWGAAHHPLHHGGAHPPIWNKLVRLEIASFDVLFRFGRFCRLLGGVCFLIQEVIRLPLPSLSGNYVMQRDRAEYS